MVWTHNFHVAISSGWPLPAKGNCARSVKLSWLDWKSAAIWTTEWFNGAKRHIMRISDCLRTDALWRLWSGSPKFHSVSQDMCGVGSRGLGLSFWGYSRRQRSSAANALWRKNFLNMKVIFSFDFGSFFTNILCWENLRLFYTYDCSFYFKTTKAFLTYEWSTKCFWIKQANYDHQTSIHQLVYNPTDQWSTSLWFFAADYQPCKFGLSERLGKDQFSISGIKTLDCVVNFSGSQAGDVHLEQCILSLSVRSIAQKSQKYELSFFPIEWKDHLISLPPPS